MIAVDYMKDYVDVDDYVVDYHLMLVVIDDVVFHHFVESVL